MHSDILTYSHLSDRIKDKGHCQHFKQQWVLISGILLGLLVFYGCATVSTNKWHQDIGGLPPKHELKAVPFYPQKAYPISGANVLLQEIAAGHPVIVLQNLGLSWIPVWHYAVVIGYDLNEGIVILHSGITQQKKTSLRAFESTWARSGYWGLVILPPYRLPASADESAYVSAVVGLERTRRWQAAVEGYQTALNQWPKSFSAHMGLSNSFYAQGDLKSAEKVLRETTNLFPNKGAAFNNLAQVLWEQGKKQEAKEAARQAVMLGGPLVEHYQKTLDEIQSGTSQK